MGLIPELADFVVICFAVATNRLLQDDAGRAVEPVPGKLPPSARVVEVAMPAETAWQRALEVGGAMGVVLERGKALNPTHLADFSAGAKALRKRAIESRALDVGPLLRTKPQWVAPDAPRLVTAAKAELLLASLERTDRVELVKAFAEADLEGTSATAVGRHVTTAAETARALEDELTFNVFEQLRGRPEPQAAIVLGEVQKALSADALQVSLPGMLRQLGIQGQAVLSPPRADRPEPRPVITGGGVGLAEYDGERTKIEKALRDAGPEATVRFEWRVVVEKKG